MSVHAALWLYKNGTIQPTNNNLFHKPEFDTYWQYWAHLIQENTSWCNKTLILFLHICQEVLPSLVHKSEHHSLTDG